jgi:hypothetical protein
MGENVQNEHPLSLVIDPADQPVIVAMNIEHGPSTHNIRVREVTLYVGQRAPVRSLDNSIPVHQRNQRIPVPLGEPENRWPTDYPHNTSLQNVNLGVNEREARVSEQRTSYGRLIASRWS